jgi:signal peptidase II
MNSKKWLYLISTVILIDQISKILISFFIDINSSKQIISSFLRFTYITNDGIAFGLNPFGNSIILFLLSTLACFFIIKILFDSKDDSSLIQFSLCLIIGGAIGNLIDRFYTSFGIMDYNGVIDFIDIGFSSYRFYIFNFADSFITIGIILYIISFLVNKKNNVK